jgi:adenine/guanine phosphoribosyltransferase-like PRPP-binding protein
MDFHKLSTDNYVAYPAGSDIKQTMHIVKKMAEVFKKIYDPEEDKIAILMRGSSGCVMASLLATYIQDYDFELIPVRKPGEDAHTSGQVIHVTYGSKVVIIDDFISSGQTMNAIYSLYDNYEIDSVFVSGKVRLGYLNFTPKHLVCSKYIERGAEEEE